MEVDGGWVLGGVHKLPAPNICIVTASAPSDGDYSLYLKAGEDGWYSEDTNVIVAEYDVIVAEYDVIVAEYDVILL